jgi:hypothetical protein
MERVVFIAVLSAVISTPIAVLFQSLIMFVLSAETEVKHKEDRRSSLRAHTKSKLNQVSSSVSDESVSLPARSTSFVNRVLHEDFGDLIRNIQNFRRTLTGDEKTAFDGKRLTVNIM